MNFVFFVVNKKASWCAVALMAFVAAACGKKGPPLAPIVRVPAQVTSIKVQRSGSEAFVTLTVPDTNIDKSMPVSISRVEVYGYTGRRPPPPARWVELADLVATVPVVPPPAPDAPAAATPVEVDASKGASPGAMITVADALSPRKLVQGKVEEPPTPRGRPVITPVVALTETDVLRRFYMAIAFSERGRPGPPGSNAEFPLVGLPEPPAYVSAPYNETTVTLEWPPSGGIVGFLFDHALPPEDPPLNEAFEPIVPAPSETAATGAGELPSGPVTYNVYRQLAPDPFAFPDQSNPAPWAEAPPAPLNPAPLTTTTFTDTVEFDRERCYVVRAVRGTAPNAVESDPSTPNCFIPVDIFPPAPPVRLVAVADEGGISLIWEPNAEADVSGYMVLRGDASDATLEPLSQTPAAEPRFRDTQVTAGKKYVYAVAALDSRLPAPNVSAPSNRVEETAR